MEDEELIKRFFTGRFKSSEDSRRFNIRPAISEKEGSFSLRESGFSLFSKLYPSPIARKMSKGCFVIIMTFGFCQKFRAHITTIISIAKQEGARFVFSPFANKDHFQGYMEEKINSNLTFLAQELRTGSYEFGCMSTNDDLEVTRKPWGFFPAPKNYQKLMANIHTLLEGELWLELPKNQIALLDTVEVQSLWKWLVKDNPNEKDQKLLRKMYTANRLLGKKQPKGNYGIILNQGNGWGHTLNQMENHDK